MPGTKTKVKILTFDWDQQIQPRLGISFVPSVSLGDKIYANVGRYYNTENKSLTRAASPTRIFTNRATFDLNGNLISDVPAANTQNKKIDAGLDLVAARLQSQFCNIRRIEISRVEGMAFPVLGQFVIGGINHAARTAHGQAM